MDILIPNIEVDLSKQDLTIMSIHPDGRVLYTPLKGKLKGKMRLTKMAALPEHGDLKDANAILRWLNAKADNRVPVTLGEIIDFIEKQPTVLEATE